MIRRARIRAEVDLEPHLAGFPGFLIRSVPHPEGAVLTIEASKSKSTGLLLVKLDGLVEEFRPGWKFEDGVVGAVDGHGRVVAWRLTEGPMVRRFSKGRLDATYPFPPETQMAFLQDRRLVAAWDRRFEILSESAIPEIDLGRRLKCGPIVSFDAGEGIAALTAEGTLLMVSEDGAVEREMKTGLRHPSLIRRRGGRVWCVDEENHEVMCITPEGRPVATADLGGGRAGSLVAHADGSASLVVFRGTSPRMVILE